MTRVVAVVQARTTSTRLPGKVLVGLEGRSIVRWVLEAAARADGIDEVVLAIPRGDEPLAEEARAHDIRLVQGPEHDTLERFRLAAESTSADLVVRLTADCPLLDASLVGEAVARTVEAGWDHHYRHGYPRGTGDAETISRRAIELAASSATATWDREHVVPWIERATDALSVQIDEVTGPLRRPELRVCVDEPSDLAVVRAILKRTSSRPVPVAEVIAVLDADEALRAVNANVIQVTAPPELS